MSLTRISPRATGIIINMIVRTLRISELPLLCGLFDYNDTDDMLKQNSDRIKSGEYEIFGLFSGGELIGELHAAYKTDDPCEAEPNKRAY